MSDTTWINADMKEYHVYRKGVWVLKEEVKQIARLLDEAQARLDRELQLEERQMSLFEWVMYLMGLNNIIN
jgi:hypothetical protein